MARVPGNGVCERVRVHVRVVILYVPCPLSGRFATGQLCLCFSGRARQMVRAVRTAPA